MTKLSSNSVLFLSLMNSPIIFLSSRGFSLSHWATSLVSIGLLRRPFSCRNWMPFLGFWLNCSVPVMRSYKYRAKALGFSYLLNYKSKFSPAFCFMLGFLICSQNATLFVGRLKKKTTTKKTLNITRHFAENFNFLSTPPWQNKCSCAPPASRLLLKGLHVKRELVVENTLHYFSDTNVLHIRKWQQCNCTTYLCNRLPFSYFWCSSVPGSLENNWWNAEA